MFSFLPQALIIISLAGIAVIILKKVPPLSDFFKKTSLQEVPEKLKPILLLALKKIWQWILEVKEISKTEGSRTKHLLERFGLNKIHFPKPHLPFLKTGSASSPEFFLEQAQADLDKENFDDAERKFIKVIEKDSKNESAYAGLGKIYLLTKKFEEAIETYKFLLKLYPENDTYWANLGQAYHGVKLYDQAVEAYEKAIELAPGNARRYLNLGLTLEAKKHLEEAILNFRKALDLEKTNTQFLLVLSEALTKKGETDEAQAILEQILVLEPTNHTARERLMELKF